MLREELLRDIASALHEVAGARGGALFTQVQSYASLCEGCVEGLSRHPCDGTLHRMTSCLRGLLDGQMTPQLIEETVSLAFDPGAVRPFGESTCPFGVDINLSVLALRRICSLAGLAPEDLKEAGRSQAVSVGPCWITPTEWTALVHRALPGKGIAVDRSGAEFLLIPAVSDANHALEVLQNMGTILDSARLDWTLSSVPLPSLIPLMDRASDTLNQRFWEHALELKVKRAVLTEGGLLHEQVAIHGPRTVGYQLAPVPVVHPVDLYHGLLRDRRLEVTHRAKEPSAVQVPCNVAADSDLNRKLKWVLETLCEDVRPMKQPEHAPCHCGDISRMLLKQNALEIARSGARVVITLCHQCRSAILAMSRHYELDVRPVPLCELLARSISTQKP